MVDPVTAYQVTFMLKGVVDNGTGFRVRALQRPMGGKTGTTNDSLDTWFMGFSPDLVAGVYVGMDTPEQMGVETGSSAASPIFTNFMAAALKDTPKVPFRIPEGVTLAPVNRNTGEPSYIGAPDFILEAFRPGTETNVGALKSTIRVGSGSDSFGNYDFGLGGDDNEDTETEDKSASVEFDIEELEEDSDTSATTDEGGEVDTENEALKSRVSDLLKDLDDEETASDNAAPEGVETPDGKVEIKTPEPGEITDKTPPKPKVEDVEEALDEGLY